MAHQHDSTVVKDGDDQWANINSQNGGYASDQEGAAHNVSEVDATDGSAQERFQMSENDRMAEEDTRGKSEEFSVLVMNPPNQVPQIYEGFSMMDTLEKLGSILCNKFGYTLERIRFVYAGEEKNIM